MKNKMDELEQLGFTKESENYYYIYDNDNYKEQDLRNNIYINDNYVSIECILADSVDFSIDTFIALGKVLERSKR